MLRNIILLENVMMDYKFWKEWLNGILGSYIWSVVNRVSLFILLVGITGCRSTDKSSDATGVFEATEVLVSAEADGRILRFDLREGDEVAAGQEVGCIDTIQLSLARSQLLENHNAAEWKHYDVAKQLAALRRQIEQAEQEVERSRALLQKNAATKKQNDDAEAQLAVLKREYEAQQTALEQANQSMRHEQRALVLQMMQLDDRLLKCRVKSPISGRILAKYAEAGELAVMGKPLFKVADIHHIFLRAYVDAPLLTHIRIGQPATVYADDGEAGRRTYSGRVVWISDEAEFTPKTIQTRDERSHLVYAVKIAVENQDGFIKLGMYGEVDFESDNPVRLGEKE